jgi:hypothetical protein
MGSSNVIQQRVAQTDTVVSGIHIPEGTKVWLFPRQVRMLNALQRGTCTQMRASGGTVQHEHCACMKPRLLMVSWIRGDTAA